MRLFRDWEVKKTLGSGSFGTVYEVENTDPLRVGERAAIKKIVIPKDESEIEVLRSDAYDDASITQTFQERLRDIVNEYRIMQQISGHTNIVNCRDIGYIQHDDGIGWDIYIVMELLTPLRKLPTERFTEEEIMRLGKDICRALSVCAKRGIIHRDVKPDNIFVSEYGDYKLGDFGISRVMEGTRASTIGIGTYDYMAPEVLRESYDRTADLYSLGMVLYWLLNERRTPFLKLPPAVPTASEKELARKRRFNGDPLPPPAHGSEELRRIVLKACAFDPKDRYQSAEEMLRDLEALSGKGAMPVLDAPVKNSATPKTEPDAMFTQSVAKQNRITTARNTIEKDDGAKTVGVFRKRKDDAEEDDATVRGNETSGIYENADTEAAENTVGVFALKEEHNTPQPSFSTELKMQPTRMPKHKRTTWPILIGIAVAAVLFVVLVLTGNLRLPTAKVKTGVRFILAGDTLTISGQGEAVNLSESIADWETKKHNINNVVIEYGITRIGNYAFSECNNLSSVSIADSVTEIGDHAFQKCSGLTIVSIPNSVSSLGSHAFFNCYNLTKVSISNNVTSINEYVFYHCNSLTDVNIPDIVTSIGSHAFFECESLTQITIPNGVTSIGDHAFSGCSGLTDISIPAGVINIYNAAFCNCRHLTSVSIPDSVKSIGVNAFSGCSNLTDINIPDSLTGISSYSFSFCSSLTSVNIPAGVTIIGSSAFYNCSSLTSVSIPESVTSIIDQAFYGCSGLQHIYYSGTNTQWNTISVGWGNSPISSAAIHFNSELN